MQMQIAVLPTEIADLS